MYYDDLPVGCSGIKFFEKEYAELKRMYVRPNYQGMGLGKKMLKHLETHAQSQGTLILRLETGIHQKAAILLYEQLGYHKIPPFGDYEEGPFNLFYEKSISRCKP